jgi:hypothetical protein
MINLNSHATRNGMAENLRCQRDFHFLRDAGVIVCNRPT